MNVPVLVKVPMALAGQLQAKLDGLLEIHLQEQAKIQKKVKGGVVDPDTYNRVQNRGRVLTMGNIARLALIHGAQWVLKAGPEDIFTALIESKPIVKGRPRAARAA